MEDILVVGAGPAGLSSAILAGRRGVDVRLLEKGTIGGELVNRPRIDDLPGVPEVSGADLRSTLVDQVQEYDVTVTLTTVETVAADGGGFLVETTDGDVRGRTVVVATGGRPRRLDVPGAEEFGGRGVFHCAACDGPLYADETVAVVGSDDWALSDAVYLSEHAARVVVFVEESSLDVSAAVRERVEQSPNVEIRTGTSVRELDGDGVLDRVRLYDTTAGTEEWEPVDGVYVQQGTIPASDLFEPSVETTPAGAAVVDARLETVVPGLFAAGDVRHGSSQTIAGAIGDGATAFHSAMAALTGDGGHD